MATFNIFFDPLHQPTALQRLDILQAAQVWSGVIQDNLVFDIQVGAHALGGAHNAMCIPGIVQDAGRTLTRAQAKLLGVAIVDIAVPAFDMVILIDNATHWVTGFAPVPHVGPAQFSLMTTVMHEICHGLGMLALCGVDNAAQTGTYSDTALIAGLPQGVAPASFFPAGLVAGYQWLTPFSALFAYQGVLAILTKGVAADGYAA